MNFEEIKEVLQNKGLKATTQRLVVYSKIIENFNHPTADEIYQSLKDEYPSISLSTVYNTLVTFSKVKILKTVKNDNGLIRFDATASHHHHLYCENSDKIQDYHNTELDDLISKFFENHIIPNFDIKEINIQFKGNFIKG